MLDFAKTLMLTYTYRAVGRGLFAWQNRASNARLMLDFAKTLMLDSDPRMSCRNHQKNKTTGETELTEDCEVPLLWSSNRPSTESFRSTLPYPTLPYPTLP